MYPVQHFKANFDQSVKVELETVPHDVAVADRIQLHDVDSLVRNICFIWEDGRKAFFNYAYLVSVDLTLTDNLGMISLSFSGQIVRLKGYHLNSLFDQLLDHSPKTITVGHLRYHIDKYEQSSLVIDIQVANE